MRAAVPSLTRAVIAWQQQTAWQQASRNTQLFTWDMLSGGFVAADDTEGDSMLEQLLKLYTTFMTTGVTSPMPHFVGPPGSGKSSVFQQLAKLIGVQLHVVNVSRISPLGLEGLEMPDKEHSALRLLISEMWTQASEGDIYLFDEFLRGFPEVFNGLLDIFTSREVRGFELPRVFIAGASNTVATYDAALEDRLLHIPVPDPRKNKMAREHLQSLLITELGLNPLMQSSAEMDELMRVEVLPMYDLLDQYQGKATRTPGLQLEGASMRNLIGQAKLRHVTSRPLKELIAQNNALSAAKSQLHYVLLLSGRAAPKGYESWARAALPNMQPLHRQNAELNLQLIEMEAVKTDHREDTINDQFDD